MRRVALMCVGSMTGIFRLSDARCGDRGVIIRVGDPGVDDEHGLELERRLLELGFVEGAHIEVLHEGLFGGDPIALKVDDMRVALRRQEAGSLSISSDPSVVDPKAPSTDLPEEVAA